MSPETIGHLFELVLLASIGLYVTALGLRWLGKKQGVSERYDEWHGRFGRFFKIAGPIIILTAVLQACLNPPKWKSLPAIAPAEWTVVKSEDGLASVLMPGKSEESTRSMEGEFGEVKLHLFKFVTGGGRYVCLFMYADHPVATFDKVSAEEFLKSARDSSLENLGGKLIEEKDQTRNGRKGKELRVIVPSKHLVLHTRTVIQRPRRVYSLSVFSPENESAPYDTDKLFDSLKIDESDPPKTEARPGNPEPPAARTN
jgi:hypothetical protein